MANHDHKSSAELEREIDHEREEIARNVDALQQKLSIGGMVDEVLHNARHGGGAFGSNLGRTISENPVPVILIGAGVAWLMAGGSSHRETRRHGYVEHGRTHGAEPFPPRGPVPGGPVPDGSGPYAQAARSGGVGEAARHRLGGAAHSASSTAHSAGHAASSAAEEARERAAYAADEAKHGAEYARQRAGERAEAARRGLSHAASSAGSYLHSASESAGRGLSSVGSYASGAASSAYGSLGHAGSRVRNGFEELLEEQPLVVGGLAFAMGAAIGGLLPNTRQENEMFGRRADALRGQAYEAAREEAEKARRVADAAFAAGQQEFEGAAREADERTPDAREAVHEGERRAGEAARRIGDAARSEAERQNLGDPASRRL